MTGDSFLDIAGFALSIVLLWKGADWVVTSAARIASRFGLSDVVIGMTIVAIGTSAPEMVVTLVAALREYDDISVSNVVGSNIFNIGIILGGCTLIRAIPTNHHLVYRDTLMLLLAGLFLIFCLHDFQLTRFEGLFMLAALAAYLTYLFKRRDEPPEDLDGEALSGSTWRDLPLFVTGLAAVVAGAQLLVTVAAGLARDFGIDEWAIGVTLVAMGTSLPELAVSIAAILRNRSGIIIGNLVGSDLFNVLAVLGLTAVLDPMRISADDGATQSLYAMGAMTFLLLIFMRTGWRLSRLEGLALVGLAMLRWSYDLTS